MQVLSAILGVFAILGMLVGFVPCFGWYNWFNIPFSVAGMVVSIIALTTSKQAKNTGSLIGLICCGIAIVLGFARWVVGGFLF